MPSANTDDPSVICPLITVTSPWTSNFEQCMQESVAKYTLMIGRIIFVICHLLHCSDSFAMSSIFECLSCIRWDSLPSLLGMNMRRGHSSLHQCRTIPRFMQKSESPDNTYRNSEETSGATRIPRCSI